MIGILKTLDNENSLYYLDYDYDYRFDDFIADKGANSTAGLVAYAYKIFPEITLDPSKLGYGCSSFCSASKEGHITFGRNFDMSAEHSGACLILHTAPKGKYSSYSTVSLKFLGVDDPKQPTDGTSPLLLTPYIPLDGINSEGLAICVLQLEYPEIHSVGNGVDMTSTTIIRNVLDNAKNVDEAVEIFKNCNLHTDGFAYHYMVGDANGNSAIIEYADNKMFVEYKKGNIQICANEHMTKEGIDFYKNASPDDSKVRMNAIAETAEKCGYDMERENSFSALRAASMKKTRWSVFYDLTEKKMSFAVNRCFENAFDFSI